MTPPVEYKLVPVRECPHRAGSEPAKDAGQVALGYWQSQIANQPGYDARLEHAAVLVFDMARRLKGHRMLERGSESSVVMDGGAVFSSARELGASAVLLAHNHPSGDPKPSDLDILSARMHARQGEARGIELLDYVIVGDGCVCSLAASGLMSEPDELERELKDADEDYERFLLLGDLVLPNGDLRKMFFDHAREKGARPDVAIREWARGLLKAHCGGQAGLDADLVVTGSLLHEPDVFALLDVLKECAAERGVTMWEYGGLFCRDAFVSYLRERIAAKQANGAGYENFPAVLENGPGQ